MMSRTLPAIAVRAAVVFALCGWPFARIALAQSSPASVENTRSQDQTQPPRADSSPDLTTVGERRSATPNVSAKYTLGVSDEVVIHALDAPEISEKPLRINPDGELRLALVGRIQAAGMTVAQLEEELKKRLAVILQEPDVTVTVTAARSLSISIMGAVKSPGVKPLETGSTILDMLSVADGVTPDAGSVVRIVRKADQGQIPLAEAASDTQAGFSVAELDLPALLDGRTPEKNIELRPNDLLAVPRADVVYVIGEVGKPGPLPLNASRSLTVMEAVSTSGGALRTAATSRARILRRVSGQEARAEIDVDLQRMMQGKDKDMPLVVGDILVVPDSSGRRIAAVAITAAIQTGLMFVTYGVH